VPRCLRNGETIFLTEVFPNVYRTGIRYADFHEKASLVKADVAAATTVRFGYPCDASIRTVDEPASCGSVHYEIRFFGYYRRCHLPSGLSGEKRDQVRLRSRLA
jgi:hypothetical protein